MSKKEMNMDIERSKLNIIHMFLQLSPEEQQLFIDEIKEIKNKDN